MRSENLSACLSVLDQKWDCMFGGLCAEGINVYYPCLPRVLRKLLKSLHPVTQPIGGIVGSVILVHQGILGQFFCLRDKEASECA